MGCLGRLWIEESLDSSEISIKTDRKKIDLPTEGLSRPIFLFSDSYFALMWYKSPHTQMCKCCSRKWLCHCQGPGCLGRANVAISLLCSGQKECRYLHGQSFLRNIVVLKTYQTTYIINSCFSYILGLNGAFLAL